MLGGMKPRWSSASFLQYFGALVAVPAGLALLSLLEENHGTAALLVVSLLALAGVAVLAESLRRRGEALLAGLLSVLAVLVVAVAAGSFVDLVGLAPDDPRESASFFQEGLGLGVLLVELAVLAAAFHARRRFAFPFHSLVIAAVLWYLVVDLLEGAVGGGNTATAILVLLVGLVYVTLAGARDQPEHDPAAFWLHVVGGLSVLGAVVWFWHESPLDWLLVLLVSLALVELAARLDRSSYAVLGALGLVAGTTYYVVRWFADVPFLPFLEPRGDDPPAWGPALAYLGLGAVSLVLGWLVARRRRLAGVAVD
jgi:hypothetical protein